MLLYTQKEREERAAEGLHPYIVTTDIGERVWWAEDEEHARAQALEGIPDETLLSIRRDAPTPPRRVALAMARDPQWPEAPAVLGVRYLSDDETPMEMGHGSREVVYRLEEGRMDRSAPAAGGMDTIEFYGASDDLIEVSGSVPGCEKYVGESAKFEVCGLRIEIAYTANRCWGIRVTQTAEHAPITATNLTVALPEPTLNEAPMRGVAPPYPAHSLRLRMDVPEGSHVTKLAA